MVKKLITLALTGAMLATAGCSGVHGPIGEERIQTPYGEVVFKKTLFGFKVEVPEEMEKMGWRMDDPHDPKMRNLPTYNPETGGLIYGDNN